MIEEEFNVGARLRAVRIAKGLSQRRLAARAGVPHGQISMIEGNHSSPSVASLRRILSALPMSMAEFFEPDGGSPAVSQVVFPASELVDLSARLSPALGARLSLRQVGDARQHNLQILHETYAPGADTGEALLEHECAEGGVVTAGEIELTVGGRIYVLRTGDAFLFDGRQPHRVRNRTDAPATIVSACTPPYL